MKITYFFVFLLEEKIGDAFFIILIFRKAYAFSSGNNISLLFFHAAGMLQLNFLFLGFNLYVQFLNVLCEF